MPQIRWMTGGCAVEACVSASYDVRWVGSRGPHFPTPVSPASGNETWACHLLAMVRPYWRMLMNAVDFFG